MNKSVSLKDLEHDTRLLNELVEYLDIETYGDVSPVEYLRQVIQEIGRQRRINFAKRILKQEVGNK